MTPSELDLELYMQMKDNGYVEQHDYEDFFNTEAYLASEEAYALPGVLSTKSFARMKEQKNIVPITDARA